MTPSTLQAHVTSKKNSILEKLIDEKTLLYDKLILAITSEERTAIFQNLAVVNRLLEHQLVKEGV